VGITKKTWAGAFMKLDGDDPVIDCFWQLGEDVIPTKLVNGQLPTQVKGLESLYAECTVRVAPQRYPS